VATETIKCENHGRIYFRRVGDIKAFGFIDIRSLLQMKKPYPNPLIKVAWNALNKVNGYTFSSETEKMELY